MLDPMVEYLADVRLPKKVTAPTHTMAMRATRKAYSTRLAPRSVRVHRAWT